MAKKKKRAVKKRTAAREGEPPEPVPYTEVEVPHPGIPRVMVTWGGVEGEERPAPKIWYGMAFEAGKPTPVEHSPHWNAMRHDIDSDRNSNWTYAYVVEQPAPPDPPPPEPEVDPEPEAARSRRR